MSVSEFDLVVIGSGPSGQKSAVAAAKLGKRVAVVDRNQMIGGVCVHTGTIPSKTLREAILHLKAFTEAVPYSNNGQDKTDVSVQDLAFRVQSIISRETTVIQAQLKRNRIAVFEGAARFVDPHTVQVESLTQQPVTLRGEHIVIACGTRPAHSPEIACDGKRVIDTD
ncbi:MAG: FAD-dependent oxidoreductase, partial [Candidatus Acidiferrales bacterium]